jgi:hypothetical protein
MARGVARSTRGGQGGRTINARTGNDANRISRKRSRARGSQRQAERLYRQNRADQRANRLLEKGVDVRTGRTFNPARGNLNAATGNPARQTDRVLVTPAPGTRRREGELNAIRNARNVRPGGGDRRIRTGPENPRTGNAGGTAAQRGGSGTASTAARTRSSGGNAGGGSTSGDPHQNRGSRRAASATSPAPAVRPRPSEARAARGQLIRQIANRRQNARRSQRAA